MNDTGSSSLGPVCFHSTRPLALPISLKLSLSTSCSRRSRTHSLPSRFCLTYPRFERSGVCAIVLSFCRFESTSE